VAVGIVIALAATAGAYLASQGGPPAAAGPARSAAIAPDTSAGAVAVTHGVTLRQIDGGPDYFATIDAGSTWMDKHILLGAWEEQPLTYAEVRDDVAMGNNIYWNLAANPLDTKDCGGVPCRVNYDVIRADGMHAAAPDTTSQSGSETVAYEGTDEADMNFDPGRAGWNPAGAYNTTSCIPNGSACGYTVARFFYTGLPTSYGSPGYPAGRKPVILGYGKGVLFWETNAQAATFLKYSDVLSADSYWMTDPDLDIVSQGGCSLVPVNSAECNTGSGPGLSTAQRAQPANYAFNVTELQALAGRGKPVTVYVETGCPGSQGTCTTPRAAVAAAWHALIAGARGITWFQHNFSGHCVDFNTFYDGSNPSSPRYKCQQSPGVTLHDIVDAVSSFNHRVASLNTVLLSPFAEQYVSAGHADVSVMAKYSRGTYYVFAASGKPASPPADNQLVEFKLAGDYTGPVTVIGENRTLRAAHGAFTDTFADQDSVHIYKIG
jgi:hypothetical protein